MNHANASPLTFVPSCSGQCLSFVLKRVSFKPSYTIGALSYSALDSCDKSFICDTLEPGKNSNMLIPAGKYKIALTFSNRFKKTLPLLLDVPGFEGIRIHSGNSSKDSSGCILPGINDSVGWVSNSAIFQDRIINLISSHKDSFISIY